MKKIAVVTNFNIYEKAVAALKVADKLFELGCEVLVASFNKDKLARQKQDRRDFLSFVPIEKIYRLLFGAGENFETYIGPDIHYFKPLEKRSCVDWYLASEIIYQEHTALVSASSAN